MQYEKGNFGLKTSQMGLTANADSSTATSLGPINLTQSFALAGFPNTPDGTVTINGETFTIADYSTVQDFMDDINTDGIDTSKSFANAGFKDPPDGSGTVTIDGWTSNALSTYATVDTFMTDVYNNTGHDFEYQSSQDTFRIKKNGSLTISESGSVGFFTAANIVTGSYSGGGWVTSSSNVGNDANANTSYDNSTDTFTIAKTSGPNLTISETGSNGFLTETNITPGTYSSSVTSSAAVSGTFSMDVSQSFSSAGFATTPDGSVTINGITFTLSDYSTVQEFMDAVNDSNADAYFFFDNTYQTFYIQQKNIGSDLVISESPDTAGAGFFTQANLTPDTYPSKGVTTTSSAHELIDMLDRAIDDISNALSYIGALINRLSYQENSLSIAITNTDSARSIIEDADMAFEQLEATKFKILQESSGAILAQANMQPQYLLPLFK